MQQWKHWKLFSDEGNKADKRNSEDSIPFEGERGNLDEKEDLPSADVEEEETVTVEVDTTSTEAASTRKPSRSRGRQRKTSR